MANRLRISSGFLLWLLSAAAGLLLLAHVVLQWLLLAHPNPELQVLADLFELEGKQNAASVFGGFLLLLVACLLLLTAELKTRSGSAERAWWWVLCGGFSLMTVNEMFRLHENLRVAGMRLLAWLKLTPQTAPLFTYAWVAAGVVIAAVALVGFLPFLVRLPGGDRRRLLTAGGVYLAGLLGMDMVTGWYAALHGTENFPYALGIAVEEGLEMAGMILLIAALLRLLAAEFPEVILAFDGQASPPQG